MSALVKVIEEKDANSIENKNVLKAIQQIFRDDLSKGVDYLEQAMKDSANQTGQQRLLEAIEKTKKESSKIQNLKN